MQAIKPLLDEEGNYVVPTWLLLAEIGFQLRTS